MRKYLDDNRVNAMREIGDIFNKYELSYNNMIGICYGTLTNVLVQTIKNNPKHKTEYMIGASKAFDYMLDEVQKAIGGEIIKK